jgi:DNA polymerase-1
MTNEQTQTDKPTERVFLIDAMSHIFRAFFAPMGGRAEPLRTSAGQPTQAVYVFTGVLRKLLHDEKPHYVAAVFDTAEKTFRHESFEAYKANRAEMPDDLASQLPYITRVCEVFRIPILKMPGYEADDIIGTLAQKASAKNIQAVIVSNDKDMCQLVRDPFIVCMRNNSQNVKRKVPVPPVEWCDEAWVEKKFGVPPAKIIDLLGLMGDSIDNIPGAPGIGEKGALQLVQQFGSIENALERCEEVKHKTYRESLKNNVGLIRQSVELATIKTDVPIELDLDRLSLKEPDRPAAYALFRELEFQALTREFADAASLADVGPVVDVPRRYQIIKRRDELDNLVRRLWETEHWAFAVSDLSSDSVDQASLFGEIKTPRGIAIATARGVSSFIDLENFAGGKEAAIAPLRDVLANGLLEKSVYDLKRAIALLETLGIEPEGVGDDILLAAYLLDPTRSEYPLSFLAREAVGVEETIEIPDGWTNEQWRTAEAADFTAQVAPVLRARLQDQGLKDIYAEMELPLAPILHQMEKVGMRVDTESLKELSERFGRELEKLTKRIYEVAGREFKINSPKQVGEVLEELNISTGRKTSTGRVSTSKDVLQELAEKYELPRLIIEYRELDKLKTVYTDTLPEQIGSDGRIHCQLNQTVAATGRLSSTNPNLQNIPIRTELGQQIRRAFIPADGCKFVSADYSQLELRILAHITRDEVMLDAFQKGEDIHARTARLVFGAKTEEEMKEKRRLAKIVNFGVAYAVEAFGLSQRVGISIQEAKKVIEDYYATYKGIRRFMEETPEKAREQGYMASIFGRRRPLPSINDRNFNVRSRAEREAINMPIQATASDIVKKAMLRVDEALRREGLKAQMIMQVHDELLIEAPNDETERVVHILKREMESAVKLDVPLPVEVGIGDNWMDAK